MYRRRWQPWKRGREHADKLRQLELTLEQARYEATRARRRYEAVDPDNRLVAGELERRWNERLVAVRELEGERETLLATPEMTLSDIDRDRLLALGADLERAWESPSATAATRKRIIRSLIHEIVVRIRDEVLDLVVHWHGGDHTALQVRKNCTGEHRWSTAADVVDLVRVLARQMPDSTIAAVLNRASNSTGRDNSWTRVRVRSLRNQHAIAAYREGERAERGDVTLDDRGLRDRPLLGTRDSMVWHDVKLIPPAYVKPYVRRGAKKVRLDAAAICEAVTDIPICGSFQSRASRSRAS